MNIIDWMKANAKFMAQDRPDLFTSETAFAKLNEWMNHLRDMGEGAMIGSGGFVLLLTEEDGFEEWEFARTVSAYYIDYESSTTGFDNLVSTSSAFSIGLDLPVQES